MIKEFAERLSLSVWDWIAVLIALSSLLVAFISLLIAKKTLTSQKQTEKNTMPIINKNIQEFLLAELILKLFDGHIKIAALWNLLNEQLFTKYPTEQILERIKIPSDTIHVELYYNSPEMYRIHQGLKEMINNYNYSIETVNRHLKDTTIKKEILYNEFFNLVEYNDNIAEMWRKVMSLIYGYNDDDFFAIFEVFLNSEHEIEENLSLKYYRQNEKYCEFVKDESNRKKLLLFMDNRTDDFKKEYSKQLIDKVI